MKPDVSCHFNHGMGAIVIAPDGYLSPREAIEHGLEVIAMGVGMLQGTDQPVDPKLAAMAYQTDELRRVQAKLVAAEEQWAVAEPLLDALFDLGENPSSEAVNRLLTLLQRGPRGDVVGD